MRLIRSVVFCFVLLYLTSCSTTYYYVVRHAEKLNQTDTSSLNSAGLQRAEVLADTLSAKNISRIFVSDKRRTQQTAAPTAALFNVTPVIIPSTNTNQLITDLKDIGGKSVLVVRHSNEIHLIVNALSPSDTIAPIPDEYNNLFVIKRRIVLWQKDIDLRRLKYGGP
jgi:phosphohistidine phosphatase SixA